MMLDAGAGVRAADTASAVAQRLNPLVAYR